MKWYVPSWNGDFRLDHVEVLGETYRAAPGGPTADTAGVKLIVTAATPAERVVLNDFLAAAVKKKWTALDLLPDGDSEIMLAATMADAGDVLVKLAKPADRTITAVSFADGKLRVVDAGDSKAVVEAAEDEETKSSKGKKKKAAAASVARATPSCPQCEPGSVKMASEVLLRFLSREQHADWARHRAITVTGGYTGRPYILAHRNSRLAQKFGRICYSPTDKLVVHFHDRSVPPEEEVLGAKLILEHRENWLRNEATMIGAGCRNVPDVFKNPFGDWSDGIADATFIERLGNGIREFGETHTMLREMFGL